MVAAAGGAQRLRHQPAARHRLDACPDVGKIVRLGAPPIAPLPLTGRLGPQRQRVAGLARGVRGSTAAAAGACPPSSRRARHRTASGWAWPVQALSSPGSQVRGCGVGLGRSPLCGWPALGGVVWLGVGRPRHASWLRRALPCCGSCGQGPSTHARAHTHSNPPFCCCRCCSATGLGGGQSAWRGACGRRHTCAAASGAAAP